MSLFQLNEDIHDMINVNTATKAGIRNNYKDIHLKNKGTETTYTFDRGALPKNINRSDGLYSATKKLSLADNEKKKAINDFKNLIHAPHQGDLDYYASYKEEAEFNDVSTSPAVKKFLNINNNSSDLNAVKPNQEYNDSYDKFFVADGDDPKTSKFNIPAALAAKTAGGDPHSDTLNNGVNKVKSSDVFKLKPVKDETEETTFKA